MEIKYIKLTLDNFKKFEHKEVPFHDGVTEIRGRNGSGKTTISDAISWCLFGKNSDGKTQYQIKPVVNGEEKHHISPTVTLDVEIDGKRHTLKRELHEKWMRPRGAEEEYLTSNTTVTYVDGEKKTVNDFAAYISSLIPDDVFRAITNPNDFVGRHWSEQRRMLMDITGGIEDGSLKSDPKYEALLKELEGESLEEYIKHKSYMCRDIKKELELIPVRIEEQNKNIGEYFNKEKTEADITDHQEKIAKLKTDISELQTKPVTESPAMKELKHKIEIAKNRINQMDIGAKNLYDKEIKEREDKLYALKSVVSMNRQKCQDIKDEQSLINIEAKNKRLKDIDAEVQEIRKEWKNNLESFSISDDATICPTCGQQLPEDVAHDNIERMRNEFNERKEKKFSELRAKAEKVKAEQKSLSTEIDGLKKRENDLQNQYKDADKALIQSNKDYEDYKSKKAPTLDEVKTEHYPNYSSVEDELARLENTTVESTEDGEVRNKQLEDLMSKMGQLQSELDILNANLIKSEAYDKVKKNIKELEDKQSELSKQLSMLEKEEDVALSYQTRFNNMVEQSVNRHFSYVTWKMSKEDNNGNVSPYCECYVGGIALHDGLNQGARVNASLDIINTLCRYYDAYAPIVTDNSESVNKLIDTKSQQIRLFVSEDENIIIK